MLSGYRYESIDLSETGWHLAQLIRQKGYSVKDIQNLLQLSCPQPVYRWIKGQVLPSINHLFNLAKILDVHMEDILVSTHEIAKAIALERECLWRKRLYAYCQCMRDVQKKAA